MQNIIFDDGYKEISINNDPNRVIRINPSDYGLLERYDSSVKTMQKAVEELGSDAKIKANGEPEDEMGEAAEMVREANKLINEQINYIFGADVSTVAFGIQSPISLVKGKFLFERFLEAIGPMIMNEFKAEQKASEKRIKEYTKQVK